jgi:hypothetical protein
MIKKEYYNMIAVKSFFIVTIILRTKLFIVYKRNSQAAYGV